MNAPTRPVLRWHGGKWKLAPWIISHFPKHRVYVEPFGGAASVLLRKPRSYAEIYNDLDDDVVNLLRVLRSPAADRLIAQIRLTPFARTEYLQSCEAAADPIERARRLVIRSFMGFGSNAHVRSNTDRIGRPSGFRANSKRNGTTPARDWANLPGALAKIVERLTGVVIENRDAMELAPQHDGEETLWYFDPPYMPATRSANKRNGGPCFDIYRHELKEDGHERLLESLRALRGMVILSGYPCRLYDEWLKDWRRVETATYADGARSRTEVLWLNPACVARQAQQQMSFA